MSLSVQNVLMKNEPAMESIMGSLQLMVMEVVWEQPFSTIREVYNSVSKRHYIMYTTIATVVNRLQDIGLLERIDRKGQSIIYRPTMSRIALVAKIREHLEDLA